MEVAMVMVVAMLGAAPVIGYLQAKTWAERQGLRLKPVATTEELAMSLE